MFLNEWEQKMESFQIRAEGPFLVLGRRDDLKTDGEEEVKTSLVLLLVYSCRE